MLIEFSIGNYRSFKDKVTFSMKAANIVAQDTKTDEHNTFVVDDKLTLLKSAAIYGANASGKSNLAKAINFMKWFMINSSKETQSTEPINVEPFALSTETQTQPSLFEMVFILDDKTYRYCFKATEKNIVSEWLFYVPKKRQTRLFERKDQEFNISKNFQGEDVQSKTRENALFISVAAQFNVEIAKKILDWLTTKIQIISGLNSYLSYTVKFLEPGHDNREEIIQLIKNLDLDIRDIRVTEREITLNPLLIPEELLKELKSGTVKATSQTIMTMHKKFDPQGNFISLESFYLDNQESEGTKKIFSIAGLLIDTLKKGNTLIFDEFDARLHPLMSKAIVEMFNSQETNYKNAQLIFMTHDTNLLNNKLFRRDQIWFTEKNKYGATDLYSLVEYKIKNDASFESDYIKGKYGAIPFIGNLSQIWDDNNG
ncbi:AAA family ATPase [Anabaena sp. CS-542/02]|uniref:AAA family ATPase n=1 Tax=Anabaena sp. CS-542/02 TaxID=3021719 RepID=UPI002330A70E|nr:ATP-binding protein [Anabaena sp. CS-542/02]MDB9445451.1 ATP-binding protein [Anabaena sp. CS-542/02]